MTESSSARAETLNEDQAMQLIAFLITSAEISLQEPVHYGTLRLIDAVSRLIGFMQENGFPDPGGFFRDLKEEIDTKKLWSMWDQPAYFQFLRETPVKVAVEMVRRDLAAPTVSVDSVS
ncbi:hypothetical protein BH24CHL4_BH24CHL4_14810 [soil metagenome]